MTMIERISAALAGLEPPAQGFNVKRISGSMHLRVGVTPHGGLVLITPADPASGPGSTVRLQNVSASSRATVEISDDGGLREQLVAGVFEVNVPTQSTQSSRAILGALAELVPKTPDPGEVRELFDEFLEIFQPSRSLGKSAVGVWGELLVMAVSGDPASTLLSWHSSVDDRFDFAAPGWRAEVKTSESGHREHTFNLLQLVPIESVEVEVFSLLTTTLGSGTSIIDLVVEIQAVVADPHLRVRLLRTVAESLGSDWEGFASHLKWDREQAEASLVTIRGEDIPRIYEPIDPAVRSVRLRVDCSGVPASRWPVQ